MGRVDNVLLEVVVLMVEVGVIISQRGKVGLSEKAETGN